MCRARPARCRTASSWCSSARRVAARARRCGCSPGSSRSTTAAIHIGDRDVTMLPPKDRDIAMVFQNYALYPHMTVAENIGFHLQASSKVPKAEIDQRVREAAGLLDLDRVPRPQAGQAVGRSAPARGDGTGDRAPAAGVPDGRAAVEPRRQAPRADADPDRRSCSAGLGVTTVYVTHDQVEAMTMGDRVAVLKDGMLQQCATPKRLFNRPANTFVAGFIGSPAMNLLRGVLTVDGVRLGTFDVPLSPEQRAALSGPEVLVGLRPEALVPVPAIGRACPSSSTSSKNWAPTPTSTAAPPRPRATSGPAGRSPCGATRRATTSGASSSTSSRMLHAVHLFDAATGRRLPDAVVPAFA